MNCQKKSKQCNKFYDLFIDLQIIKYCNLTIRSYRILYQLPVVSLFIEMSGLFVNGVTDDASIKPFDELENSIQTLIKAAIEARKNAYCPYSNFAVGAAIKTNDGTIYTGSNIENGAYSSSLCAERVAAAKAISDGKRQIAAVAVVGLQADSFTTPCGLCRQFLIEFAKTDFPIYVAKPINPPLRVLCTSISQLLPKSFKLDL